MSQYGLCYRLIILFFILSGKSHGLCFDLPSQQAQIIGKIQWIKTTKGDTFNTISKHFGIGFHEIAEANPRLVSDALVSGNAVMLPTRFILPATLKKGIVINLAELRLYYYGLEKIYTYPVGIGRIGWDTPLGLSYVLAKLINPTWHVPKSIQEASKREGSILPDQVLCGEDNPLGPYALRLHYHNYLIHGTNEVEGVGRRSTAGCVRMFPEDMKELFEQVEKDTIVNIINEPYKVGWDDVGTLYLEAHVPLEIGSVYLEKAQLRVTQLISHATYEKQVKIEWDMIQDVLKEAVGVPVAIGSLEAQEKG